MTAIAREARESMSRALTRTIVGGDVQASIREAIHLLAELEKVSAAEEMCTDRLASAAAQADAIIEAAHAEAAQIRSAADRNARKLRATLAVKKDRLVAEERRQQMVTEFSRLNSARLKRRLRGPLPGRSIPVEDVLGPLAAPIVSGSSSSTSTTIEYDSEGGSRIIHVEDVIG